mgnify:CR=1 FL=1
MIHSILLIIIDSQFVMLQGFIKLSELVVLHASEVVVFGQFFLMTLTRLLRFTIFFYSYCHGEIKECSLEVTHVVIAFATKEECS